MKKKLENLKLFFFIDEKKTAQVEIEFWNLFKKDNDKYPATIIQLKNYVKDHPQLIWMEKTEEQYVLHCKRDALIKELKDIKFSSFERGLKNCNMKVFQSTHGNAKIKTWVYDENKKNQDKSKKRKKESDIKELNLISSSSSKVPKKSKNASNNANNTNNTNINFNNNLNSNFSLSEEPSFLFPQENFKPQHPLYNWLISQNDPLQLESQYSLFNPNELRRIVELFNQHSIFIQNLLKKK